MLYDLIIVGGGIAGLTAAIYARRGGLNTLLLEGGAPGGQIIASPELENYPALPKISGVAFVQRLLEQTAALELEIKYETVSGLRLKDEIKVVQTANGAEYQAKTLIWAAGLVSRRLDCPGEEQFLGRGVSFCAACDGMLYKGKDVAVIGGGNTALEEALFLSKICLHVHLVHRRDSFRAEAALVQKIKERPNIVMHMPAQVSSMEGGKRLEQLVLQKPDGREVLPVAAVFQAIGKLPANQLLSDSLALDATGFVIAGEDCSTALPGVYVAGDCRTKPLRQLITAAADGAVAASRAIAYMH